MKRIAAAAVVLVPFIAYAGVVEVKMKLPVNPPLIGMLPRKRKSVLFAHDVTTWHKPAPLVTKPFQEVVTPSVALMSSGWLGTSTVKQWSSTWRPESKPPPTTMPT